ncbi:MAG: transglutaminase-like domain-containing protein [Terriglobia bacterium]
MQVRANRIGLLLLVAGASGAVFGAAPPEPRSASFEVRTEVRVAVPPGSRHVRVWVPLPQQEPGQEVRDLRITAPSSYRLERDSDGNQLVYLEAAPPREKEWTVAFRFTLARREFQSGADPKKSRPLTAQESAQLRRHLSANTHIPLHDGIRKLADEIVGAETNPVAAARKLYDWMIANVDYYAVDPKSKQGSEEMSASYCLAERTGNCGDMGALWIALARARGIPARIVYGSFFKPDLDGKDQDVDAHSWVEFYAPGLGWVPHDVALGDIFTGNYSIHADNAPVLRLATSDGTFGKFPQKADYFFGNLDERRMAWSRGRDVVLTPRQTGGPVNAFFEAHVEVDGKPLPKGPAGWLRKVTYREKRNSER